MSKRTGLQNKTLWFILNCIADQLKISGSHYTSNCWHVYFRQRYLGCVDITIPNGSIISMPRSTADLNKEEFSEYLEKLMAWCSAHDVILPEIDTHV